ncbi:MAG: ActS/PrrB/RegB family redox-sensitive histidine kinase [Candidatus Paracaedibacteraceae bacterium]|nr:ActS/PrrB/RegB family redox-sensitive histidine kinase [Candidatus Paracaedibacteraceae bacterium]
MQSYRMSHIKPSISFSLLITLRWVALLGQTITLILVDQYFQMIYPTQMTWLIVVLSVTVNIALMVTQQSKHKIPAPHIYWYLIYDIGQLTALLYLTGGLNNPFSVFLLAPVVIAAGFLPRRDALIVTGCGLIATFILYGSTFPLPWDNTGLVLPERLRFAVLVAISVAMIFTSIYVGRVAHYYLRTTQALQATELALAREQKLASLGALAAAAAHELGSPLTTMMLVIKELQADKNLNNLVKDDVRILAEQMTRCRDILQGLSRDFAAEHTLPFKALPLRAALDVVITSHGKFPGKQVQIDCAPEAPLIELTPELQHALGNIIANAVQFAQYLVTITCQWTEQDLTIKIADDGEGYPESMLNRLGDPYVSSRTNATEGVHLGLGLFIAQSLIEKRGGVMYFYNDQGAVCEIVFSRQAIEVRHEHSGN